MKSACNWSGILLGLALTVLALPAWAFGEYTKTIKKEFDINATGTTYLINKYGKTDVKIWDKNRVKISVTIVVNASTEASAQTVFDRIKINFSNAADYAKAETSIESTSRGWFNSFTNNGKSDYRINYEVYMPATCNLNVNQKYGDLYAAAITGKADVEVKYGNFKLEEVGDDSKIVLAYGHGAVVKGKDLNLDISYGELNVGESANLTLDSHYSTFNLDKIGSVSGDTKYDNFNIGNMQGLKLDGQYDNFKIGEATTVEMNCQYTQVSVAKIWKSIDLDLNYGSAKVRLAKNVSSANINGNYTDVSVTAEPGLAMQMEVNSNYAPIRYPAELEVTTDSKKGSAHYVKGFMGKSSGGVVLKATLNYGGFKLIKE
jgi:hypothetical protein